MAQAKDRFRRSAPAIGHAVPEFVWAAIIDYDQGIALLQSAGWKLWTHQGAEFSLPGLTLCVLAVLIMYFLSRCKLALAETLGSRALKADAVESITCGGLSLVVVVALNDLPPALHLRIVFDGLGSLAQ
jgi:hypothetical protein